MVSAMDNYLAHYPYNGLKSIYTQAWINDLTHPEAAWNRWKRTGYPKFADFKSGRSSKIGNGSGIAYLETLYDGNKTLIIPRRGAFRIGNLSQDPTVTGSTLNEDNFNKALQTMISKDPGYGPDGLYAIGRIWWDMK
jgi:hypothetical protein